MPSRRTHTKSRHGCSQCKAAHIKVCPSCLSAQPYRLRLIKPQCDLVQPTCGKCTRLRRTCHFPSAIDNLRQNTQSTPPSQKKDIPGSPLLLSAPPASESTNVALAPHHASDTALVSWDDLELLHHYLTDTYTTLTSRNDLRQMWQVAMPKLAQQHRFLMHSIFSVTALHLASSHPPHQSSYIDRAIRHHNIALQQYRYALAKTPPRSVCSASSPREASIT